METQERKSEKGKMIIVSETKAADLGLDRGVDLGPGWPVGNVVCEPDCASHLHGMKGEQW